MSEATKAEITTELGAEALFNVVIDLENYPDWVDGMKSVEVTEVFDDGLPATAVFVLQSFGQEITYTLSYEYDGIARVAWSLVESEDVKSLDGSYEFFDLEGGGTAVEYSLSVEPNFPVPKILRRQVEKQITSSALKALVKRAGKA